MELHGQVVKRPVAAGSKSARTAVMLETESGSYVLRRQGSNPFSDPVLESLVGKSIACQGDLHGYTFIVTSWTETTSG